MSVEWDPEKARTNVRKHGIDFADAVGALEDPYALWREDERPYGEDRYLALGMDYEGRVLIVAFAFRSDNVRVISARRASRREQEQYERRRT